MRLVLVRWRDAWFDLEGKPEEWRQSFLVETVGWVVRQVADVVSVAQELLPDDEGFRAITHIPTAVIVEIVPLRPS